MSALEHISRLRTLKENDNECDAAHENAVEIRKDLALPILRLVPQCADKDIANRPCCMHFLDVHGNNDPMRNALAFLIMKNRRGATQRLLGYESARSTLHNLDDPIRKARLGVLSEEKLSHGTLPSPADAEKAVEPLMRKRAEAKTVIRSVLQWALSELETV